MTTCNQPIRLVLGGRVLCPEQLNDKSECAAYHPVLATGSVLMLAGDWPARLASVRPLTDIARSHDGVRMLCGWGAFDTRVCSEIILARASGGGSHATVLDVVNAVLKHHHEEHAEL